MKRVMIVAAVLFLVAGAVFAAEQPEKPNFVIIYADDLGWQDVKVYDNMETNVVGGFGG
ncbi:MAG: hypothetical protein HN341_16145, partial [Verrucomicrobia bacterium]|nr:hypothetical protein [Verrucomicrobiota bacterium]